MKRYSSTAVIVTIISMFLFASCKKDAPDFKSAATNGNSFRTATPPPVKGPVGILWPDTTKIK